MKNKYAYLDNPIFDEPLCDLDSIILEALGKMFVHSAEEATVSLKIDIARDVDDGALKLKHNANYNVPYKGKITGETPAGQFALLLTPEGLQIHDTMEQLQIGGESVC